MTANSEVIYAFSVLDLAKTGPVIAEVPAGLPGGSWDFWERGIEDIGLGRSEHGGKFLLLPPGSDVEAPADVIPVRSKTNNVFMAARGIPKPGESVEPFVKLVSSIKLYRLSEENKPTKIILNGGKPFDSDWPKDFRFFQYMAEGLNDAVIEPQDKLMYAMIRPLGIEPGKPFQPDERMRRILTDAATTGAAMVTNLAFANRFEKSVVWPDRTWERSILTTTPGNEPYIAKIEPGQGQWYASTFRDASGEFLDGSKTYKLTLRDQPRSRRP